MLRYLQEGSNYTDGIHAKYCNKKTQRNTFSFGNNSGAREGGTHSHRLFAICMGKPVGPRVKANGTQNSGLVNFDRPGISFTICANQFHLPENDREGLTGIKDGLEK